MTVTTVVGDLHHNFRSRWCVTRIPSQFLSANTTHTRRDSAPLTIAFLPHRVGVSLFLPLAISPGLTISLRPVPVLPGCTVSLDLLTDRACLSQDTKRYLSSLTFHPQRLDQHSWLWL